MSGKVNRPGERQRQPPSFACHDARAHALQRLGHACHGSPAQGSVAGKERRQVVTRDHTHQQPCAGAGIAEIEYRRRLLQSADADAIYRPGAGRVAHDAGAERTHRGGRAQHVLAFEEAFDARAPDSEAAQDQGTVRDRFVARNATATAEGAGGSGR